MHVTGRAIVIKDDNVDTDALYPGKHLNVIDPVQAKSHLFEGLDPKLRELLTKGDTVLFVGENFGCGSSRPQPATTMAVSGVRAVVAKSLARIFVRNCVNAGMPAFVNADAVLAAMHGAQVQLDLTTGMVTIDGLDYASKPVVGLQREILDAGGLVPWIRTRLAE